MATHTSMLRHEFFSFGNDLCSREALKISMTFGAGRLDVGRREYRTVKMLRRFPPVFPLPFGLLGFVFWRVRGAEECRRDPLAAVAEDAAEFLRRSVPKGTPMVRLI